MNHTDMIYNLIYKYTPKYEKIIATHIYNENKDELDRKFRGWSKTKIINAIIKLNSI